MRLSDLRHRRAVLGAVKARPGGARASREVSAMAGLDLPCARRDRLLQAGTKERPPARTKELHEMRMAPWMI